MNFFTKKNNLILSGDITLDNALEVATYNSMMSFVLDIMAKYALQSSLGHFLFTGFFGGISAWLVSLLLKFAAKEGRGFLVDNAYEWKSKEMMTVYISSVNIIYKDLNQEEGVLSDEKIEQYKNRIKDELKKFYNLSAFVRGSKL